MVIGGIHDDLCIELSGAVFEHYMRSLPSLSIVVADQQQHGRDAAILAVEHGAVMRIKNIKQARTIGGRGRFPLVATGQANAFLRGKLRRRRAGRTGKHNCHERKRQEREFRVERVSSCEGWGERARTLALNFTPGAARGSMAQAVFGSPVLAGLLLKAPTEDRTGG